MIRYKHLIVWPERDPEAAAYYCEITDKTGKEVYLTENEPSQAAAVSAAKAWIDAHPKGKGQESAP